MNRKNREKERETNEQKREKKEKERNIIKNGEKRKRVAKAEA